MSMSEVLGELEHPRTTSTKQAASVLDMRGLRLAASLRNISAGRQDNMDLQSGLIESGNHKKKRGWKQLLFSIGVHGRSHCGSHPDHRIGRAPRRRDPWTAALSAALPGARKGGTVGGEVGGQIGGVVGGEKGGVLGGQLGGKAGGTGSGNDGDGTGGNVIFNLTVNFTLGG